MKNTIAIYPGSFNPFTIGHQNILEKAERIFGKDNVIIAVGINPEKKTGIDFNIHGKGNSLEVHKDYRVETIKGQLSSKNIEGYIGFLTEYVREKEAEGYNVVVIRGLRNGHDFDYEYNQIRFMWDQMPMLNIMCLFADPAYMHVSSSAYRALEKVKPGAGHKYLAREVEVAIVKKPKKKEKPNYGNNFIEAANILKTVKDVEFPVELYRFGTYTQYESAGEEVNKWEEIDFFDDYEIEDNVVEELDGILSFLDKKYIKSIGGEMYGQNVLLLNEDGTTEIGSFRI